MAGAGGFAVCPWLRKRTSEQRKHSCWGVPGVAPALILVPWLAVACPPFYFHVRALNGAPVQGGGQRRFWPGPGLLAGASVMGTSGPGAPDHRQTDRHGDVLWPIHCRLPPHLPKIGHPSSP